MKMNYNDWFYEFHKYFTAYDTSWVDIGNRYKRLQETHSELLQQQPFGIMGNKYGFEKLMELLSKSNYSFKDVDDAMVKTYEQTLRRAMGKMLVNTHAVIYHADNLSDKSIHMERGSSYYIADVPYDQLHFGERDEFIRQKLNKMHDSVNQQYIHVSEFTTNAYTKLLDFSLMCTINGKICNEFYVGFNDYGFRFKFAYGGLGDAEVIIYKLDQTDVTIMQLSPSDINGTYLKFDTCKISDVSQNCIVDIYMDDYAKQVQVVPNFGTIDEKGVLWIPHLQTAALQMLERYQPTGLTMMIYHTKFLHEINGIFPALNYMNFTHNRPVYTDLNNPVVNLDGNPIIASTQDATPFYDPPICTPPICIDRTYDLQFDVLVKCVNLYQYMETHRQTISKVTEALLMKDFKTYEQFKTKVIEPLRNVYQSLYPYYTAYVKGALLTNLVSSDLVSEFSDFMESIDQLTFYSKDDWDNKYDYRDLIHPAFYGSGYQALMERLSDPYRGCKSLQVFNNIQADIDNFLLEQASPNRFNRPIAEQCFISLAYSKDDQAWVFAYPNIKRFKGIENTFYINDNLYEDDMFKFFVLYTDTFYPSAQEIDDTFTLTDVLDYDTFITETERYLGFIRYWDVENQLMKLSKILYGTYSDETVVQVMSDMLRGKIDTKDLIHTNWSQIQYDRANITSDQIHQYTESSERAPFALNYLFYTLSVLNDGDDNSQAMFYHILTNDKFDERYLDYNISKAFENQPTIPMNFSQFHASFNSDSETSNPLNDGNVHLYYGIPGIKRGLNNVDNNAYTYAFEDYTRTDTKYMLIDNMSIDKEHWLMGTSPADTIFSYYYETQLAKLCTKYLNCIHDLISYLETNYKTGVNHTFVVESSKEALEKIYDALVEFQNTAASKLDLYAQTTLHSFIENEPFLKHGTTNGILDNLLDVYLKLQSDYKWNFGTTRVWTNPLSITRDTYQNLYRSIDWWLKCLKHMYYRYGFKTNTIRRVRNLYLYFKKFHKQQNIYQFKQLHLQIDHGYFYNRDSIANAVSDLDDTNKSPARTTFKDHPSTMYKNLALFRNGLLNNLNDFDLYQEILTSIEDAKNNYIANMEEHVAYVMNNQVFDMYVIDEIQEYDDIELPDDRDTTISAWDEQPSYMMVTLTSSSNDNHLYPPSKEPSTSSTKNLYFNVASQYIDGRYVVKRHGGIRKNCEYAFFNGTTLENLTFSFYRKDGTKIGDRHGRITFRRISNSAQLLQSMEMLYHTTNTHVDLQNIHEDMRVNNNGCTVVSKVNGSNYEMLYGNRYQQLQHTSEMILQKRTMLPGSIDRIYLSNQDINRFILSDIGSCPTTELFFKPSQIMHPEITMRVDPAIGYDVTSIGGKYFENQKIYITTNDELHYTFPAYITAIDHSQSRGFVEARVDHRHAKWIPITDPTLIHQYLTTNISCTVLDDNISNFLDEFSNSEYKMYYNPSYDPELEFYDEDYPDMLSVPGDPVYVYTHGDYVYTRVNGMFHNIIPNPYPDEAHKHYRFHFMGWNCWHRYENELPHMCVKLMNVNRSLLTDPELYPILRDEPNDHNVMDLEKLTYQKMMKKLESKIAKEKDKLQEFHTQLDQTSTVSKRIKLQRQIEQSELDIKSMEDKVSRLASYLDEPEHATTWYNVTSYEAAQTYMTNDRTRLPRTYEFDVRDIPMSSKLEVLLYNWDKKEWIKPSSYTVKTVAAGTYTYTNFDDTDAYDAYRVRTFNRVYIEGINNEEFPEADRIFIYFAYQTADVFDEITLHDKTCNVRFKPILSTNNNIPDDPDEIKTDVYDKLCVRKHLDLEENYHYDATGTSKAQESKENWESYFHDSKPDFDDAENVMVFKIKRNRLPHRGDRPYTPKPRFCHMDVYLHDYGSDRITIHETAKEYHVLVKNPLVDTHTPMPLYQNTYVATIIQPIDNFLSGEDIKLICIDNRKSQYDGNVSSIIFHGITDVDENQNQVIRIIDSNVDLDHNNSYTCTVLHDSDYGCIGGLINIDVSKEMITPNYTTNDDAWIEIPSEYVLYMEIPDEFVLIPNHPYSSPCTCDINLSVTYKKASDDQITNDGTYMMNPFEYYYDAINKLRYPISNIRHEQYDKRLTYNNGGPYLSGFDREYRQVVRSNHLHVCRYCCYNIPKNGFIDVTGYIPTPLSRRRYEFWVNGRQLKGVENLIILSPTSFQLINLVSLKNFELIELVDDVNDTLLSNKNSVYIDLEGNVYTSYQQAFLSNHELIGQDMRYAFYGYPNHTNLQDISMGFITNPNNVDVEPNIMDTWNNGYLNEEEYDDYNDYYNIPKINGVSIYHPTSDDLGMREIPNYQILPYFDQAWKKEILTNPLFPMTHFDGSMTTNQLYVLLHITESLDKFTIHTTGTYTKFFTLYVSKSQTASIADVNNTIQIIPFIHVGTRVILDKDVRGYWIHATVENYIPQKIQ